MSERQLVRVSECTLRDASGSLSLSFREKIELCKLMDRLNMDLIEMDVIRQNRIDSLLVKSVSSAVKNAAVAVPVLLEDENVQKAWEALREAREGRLQVSVPISSVQMEYLMHLKPKALISTVERTLTSCRALTPHVEFIAQDATRADAAFLREIVAAAVRAGAEVVTVCDTAGSLLPSETDAFISSLLADVPELAGVTLGYGCSDHLGMAEACAFAAIRAGAREIKASVCHLACISLPDIVRALEIKGGAIGARSRLGVEQLRRISQQVDSLCHYSSAQDDKAPRAFSEEHPDRTLNAHDSRDAVLSAIQELGYELSPEDQEKVWARFVQTGEKKETISLMELDAIIAAEAMQVPPVYHEIQYVINTGNAMGAMAHMRLKLHEQELEGISSGDGAIDAAFRSIEQATGRHYELDEFQIKAVTEGHEAMGEALVKLRCEGRLYSGRGISTDIIGASIQAYMSALNKIVYEEEEV